MYLILLIIHNAFRWVALGFLIYSTCLAYNGYRNNKLFSNSDNAIRHWTATILQIQMMIGFVLYFNSPFVQAGDAFFKAIHPTLMFIAVVVISIGSAMAKRKSTDKKKFKTMLVWFGIGLLIILISIPWPFSPLSQRPYIRIS